MGSEINREKLFSHAVDDLSSMLDTLDRLTAVTLGEFDPRGTVAVCVDLNNGFVTEGALFSERSRSVVADTVLFYKACLAQGIKTIGYTDTHTDQSPELASYPVHCMAGTTECEFPSELSGLFSELRPKNSTNALFADTRGIVDSHPDAVIISGCCSDICIYQFAVGLKAYFNEHNEQVRVVVPLDLIQTYDAPWHSGDLMHTVFCYSMLQNGVEVVAGIQYAKGQGM